MDVSENRGTPKSSILIGFSIVNHPFWGTPIFGNIHIVISSCAAIHCVLTHVNPPVTKMEWIPQFTARIQKSGANDKVTNLRFEDSLMSSSKIDYLAIQESFKLSALEFIYGI